MSVPAVTSDVPSSRANRSPTEYKKGRNRQSRCRNRSFAEITLHAAPVPYNCFSIECRRERPARAAAARLAAPSGWLWHTRARGISSRACSLGPLTTSGNWRDLRPAASSGRCCCLLVAFGGGRTALPVGSAASIEFSRTDQHSQTARWTRSGARIQSAVVL